MDAAEFAQLEQVYDFALREFDTESGSAVVSFSLRNGDNYRRSVRIDLLNGSLLPYDPEPLPEPSPFPSIPSGTGERSSPSGRMIAYDRTGAGQGIVLESGEGKKIAALRGRMFEGISDMRWAHDESALIYVQSGAENSDDGLYAFSIADREAVLLEPGSIRCIESSPDHRYLTCIRLQDEYPERVTLRDQNRSGTLLVLDADGDFSKVHSIGGLVYEYGFSPGSARMSFVELVDDEFGDYQQHRLSVFDVESGESTSLTTGRYKPLYEWCGDDLLAVTTYDKYAVPTLNLISADGTERTELVTDASFAHFEAVGYIPSRRQVIYRAYTGLHRNDVPEELWSVRPGAIPVRLIPRGRN